VVFFAVPILKFGTYYGLTVDITPWEDIYMYWG